MILETFFAPVHRRFRCLGVLTTKTLVDTGNPNLINKISQQRPFIAAFGYMHFQRQRAVKQYRCWLYIDGKNTLILEIGK